MSVHSQCWFPYTIAQWYTTPWQYHSVMLNSSTWLLSDWYSAHQQCHSVILSVVLSSLLGQVWVSVPPVLEWCAVWDIWWELSWRHWWPGDTCSHHTKATGWTRTRLPQEQMQRESWQWQMWCKYNPFCSSGQMLEARMLAPLLVVGWLFHCAWQESATPMRAVLMGSSVVMAWSLMPTAQPYAMGIYCFDLFKDGECDQPCNSEECLWDGFDCQPQLKECNPFYDTYCTNHYGNGHCDKGCDNAECGWDGLDCETTPESLAEGTLVLIVMVPPDEFRANMVNFLRGLGHLLHSVVRVKKDAKGEDMIYPWPRESGRSKRSLRLWPSGQDSGGLARVKRNTVHALVSDTISVACSLLDSRKLESFFVMLWACCFLQDWGLSDTRHPQV